MSLQPSPRVNHPAARYVVFTDLDGTLLDHHTYSFAEAQPGLELLRQHHIPLVFCSAKTRAEQMVYRNALQIRDPFIVENGGAVFVEQGYFKQPHSFTRSASGFDVLEFARPCAEVRKILSMVRDELQLPLKGYGDMTLREIAELTGLDEQSAALASQREYEETVVTQLSDSDRERFRAALARHGVMMTAGARFISISTANDKGRATKALIEMYRREWGETVTVGIGDSWNDAPLLSVTDLALQVQQPGGTWARLAVKGIRRIKGVGPKGWTLAMSQLVDAKPALPSA
ncbi:MAG: HAD-IIB family hydrolase [Verrucomicrobia bacterium]|nr:HAD-IIB family hydrolase [Verrucomicrobiota bacterium]